MRKTLLVLALVLIGVFSFAFKDVPKDHWAYDYVMDLANRGILPMEDNFNPDIVLTKAEVAVLLSDTLTYVENDPVLAKAEDIKRVETVMKMLDKKMGDLSYVVNEKFSAFETKLGAVESAVTANQNVLINLSKKVNALDGVNEKVESLSKDLNKTNDKLDTITKVAYRAFNNADMVSEDMLDLQDQLDELSSQVSDLPKKMLEMQYLINDLSDRLNASMEMAKGEKAGTSRALAELKYKVLDLEDRLNALPQLKDDVDVNSENIDGLWEELNTLKADVDNFSGSTGEKLGELESAVNMNQTVLNTLTKSNEELKGKVAANEEKVNKANTLAMVGVALAIAAAALGVFAVTK
jgi:chromosome segregation ATPase